MADSIELDPGVKEALQAVEACVHMPPQMARNYLEMLGHAATKYMRAKFGDEYLRGWLDSALAELDQPPMIVLRRPS